MESLDFIEKLKELTSREDVLAVSREVNELRSSFENYLAGEERKVEVVQEEGEETEESTPPVKAEKAEESTPIEEGQTEESIPAEEVQAEESTPPVKVEETEESTPEVASASTSDFGKGEFYEIFKTYSTERKRLIDERNSNQLKNLAAKKEIITRLKGVVSTEENIGAAFGAFKEIQDTWKEIGDIPRDDRNEIQKEYSKLLEDFFYNINIYKQLKEHDFHRNHQLKIGIIESLKTLQKVESMKELETEVKRYQSEWDEVGPVPNDSWELLKESYWTEVRSLNNRINRFYEDRREEQRGNIDKKKALVEEVKALVTEEEMASLDGNNAWEAKSKIIIEAQNQWKTIGFGSRKENEEIWKEFRAVCDTFFNAKKAFYDVANVKLDAIAEKKKALIERANALKTNTDWKDTSERLIRLQKDWKLLGHAGRKNEQKLWKAFRSACDSFFTAKQKHYEDQDKQYENNVVLKDALLVKIEAYKPAADKSQAIADLQQFGTEFNAIGRVPIKVKDSTYNAFKKVMDTHYGNLKMEGSEKETIMFQAKIETMRASPNSSRLFEDAKADLRREMDKHVKEVRLLENNLGFFANSKGADSMKKDVEKKVQFSQEKIKTIRLKLKMIPNE